MTQKQITDNNKLIGTFMDCKSSSGGSYYVFGRYHKDTELKYHKFWDWLMPVIEKINKLDDCAYKININTSIITTYEAVIVFIKWYNKQNV